jgi:hypothetical protein
MSLGKVCATWPIGIDLCEADDVGDAQPDNVACHHSATWNVIIDSQFRHFVAPRPIDPYKLAMLEHA